MLGIRFAFHLSRQGERHGKVNTTLLLAVAALVVAVIALVLILN